MNRSAAWLATALVSSSLLTGCTGAAPSASTSPSPESPAFADGAYAIDCDTATHARGEATAVSILGPDAYRVGGWSHVNGVGAFETVAQPVGAYKITAENYVADESCAGDRTLAVVLAKKTYDWDRQHANGIEAQFPTEKVAFGNVTDIVIELHFDPTRSVLPTAGQLADAYGDLLTADELAQLDGGHINLELTLYGTGATADAPFMNAGVMLDLDPADFGDGWVRVQVPRDELTWYTEDNYVRTEVGATDYQDLLIQGLRINPETSGRLTVRHFVLDAFDPQAKPELFKEMALTIALVEVGRVAADD